MNPPGIVTVGSLNIDLAVWTSRRPQAGETFSGEKFTIGFGGKGGNQAIQAALSGAHSYLAARLGNDLFAPLIYAALDNAQVDRAYVQEDPAGTGIGHLVIDAQGDYSTVIIARANGNLGAEDIERAAPAFAASQVLLLQLEIPLPSVIYAAQTARRMGLQVFLNAAPARRLPPELLAAVDVLIVNEIEAAMLSGLPIDLSPQSLAAALNRLQCDVPNVVITLGAGGVIAQDNHRRRISMAGHPVEVVNTVGAGDALIGELAVRMAGGEELCTALPYANAAGALAVTRQSAYSEKPDREKIAEMANRLEVQITQVDP